MAKNNPYWGKQKGKLGETVLAVVKGQQVQRAYNAEPLNPKTKKQTDQRMIFASAVKFFKSAIDQQFKFAYEDRKQQESDYNAYMRHNIGISLPTTKEALDQANFIPFGPYVVSDGSLNGIPTERSSNNFLFKYNVELESAPTTLQQTANAFKQGYNLLDGDIITFVFIDTTLDSYKGAPHGTPKWTLLQIKVGDSSDTRTWSQLPSDHPFISRKSDINVIAGVSAGMAGVIVSRPTAKGLKVSTCTLLMNTVAQREYLLAKTPAVAKENELTWGATQNAVLEGSLLPG